MDGWLGFTMLPFIFLKLLQFKVLFSKTLAGQKSVDVEFDPKVLAEYSVQLLQHFLGLWLNYQPAVITVTLNSRFLIF